MWLFFFKTGKLVQIYFIPFILMHRSQINKRVVKPLCKHFRIWTYFGLVPLFLFLEKIKVNVPYFITDKAQSKKFQFTYPKISVKSVVPRRIKEKNIRTMNINQNRNVSLFSYDLINKKKRRNIFFSFAK